MVVWVLGHTLSYPAEVGPSIDGHKGVSYPPDHGRETRKRLLDTPEEKEGELDRRSQERVNKQIHVKTTL